mgnify:CR=1 FL=1
MLNKLKNVGVNNLFYGRHDNLLQRKCAVSKKITNFAPLFGLLCTNCTRSEHSSVCCKCTVCDGKN